MSIEKTTINLTTLADKVNAEHRACEEAVGAALGHAINAGELLTEAKANVSHGSWGAWLKDNFEGSERTAQAYMKVYRRRDEIRNGAADLSLRGALKELEAKSTLSAPTNFYAQEWVPHESGQGHRVGRTFYTMEEYAQAHDWRMSPPLLVDAEFHGLLPPLQDSEYAGLERSIVREGCRNPILAWNNTILDGHARYEICVKHGIDYLVCDVDMEDRTAAMVYIIDLQMGRKNLQPYEADYMRAKARVRELMTERAISEEQAWEEVLR